MAMPISFEHKSWRSKFEIAKGLVTISDDFDEPMLIAESSIFPPESNQQ